MNIKALEEFQYKLGDCRPYLFDYIMKQYPNFGSYDIPRKNRKFISDAVFKFVCDKVKQKRVLIPPKGQYMASMMEQIESSSKPLILLPILIRNKLNCKQSGGGGRHLCFVLYNKMTHEIVRFDIRTYHLNGFNLKLLVSELSKSFSAKYISHVDPGCDLAPDLDVPVDIMKKIGVQKARDAYPIFLLAYAKDQNDHPRIPSENIVKRLSKFPRSKFEQVWSDYVDYRTELPSVCGEGRIENPQSGRCLLPLSKSLLANTIEKPRKECSNGMVYNSLLDRCTSPNKVIDVNIMLNEASKSGYDMRMWMTHIGSQAKIILGVINYLMRKYPHAMFLYSNHDGKSKKTKRDLKIVWEHVEETDTFKLELPSNYWEMWKEAQFNPNIQYIITLVGLREPNGGQHANVLIYDKSSNEIERFDGLGRDIALSYNVAEFDEEMKKLLSKQKHIFKRPPKYFSPFDFCPRMPVFQSKELDEIPGKDLHGNCAVWRFWYIDIRLANPHLNRKQLVALAAKKLDDIGSLYKFIKMYQNFLLKNVETLKSSK